MYEEAVAVPFLMAGPGIKSSIDNSHLVSGLDILPTLLDYAGIAIPPSLAGRSLPQIVDGDNPAWREYVVAEYGQNADLRMVRTLQYKYVVYAKGANPEQFFDCDADPGETNNFITEISMKAQIDSHRNMLREFVQTTQDNFKMPQTTVNAQPAQSEERGRR